MAFHDSEITALQGWAGGMPAVKRPQPAPTRSQVLHDAALVGQPSLRPWELDGLCLVEHLAEGAWICLTGVLAGGAPHAISHSRHTISVESARR
jgi:hypothetical protein